MKVSRSFENKPLPVDPMTIETINTLGELFGWISLINMSLLLLSTVLLFSLKPVVVKMHSKMFGLDGKDLNRAYFQYLAQFKILIIVFNVTPYIALKLMG
ncbi:MAG: hypothetical protein QM496_11310 [Verrucomicrobiota bacterium]